MKNLVSQLKKTIKPLFLATAITLSSLVNAITQEKQENYRNAFIRPNITPYVAAYGSGDVNSDGIVDEQDLELIKTNQYTNPDLADVNGDGLVDQQDISLLESYLNNEIPYLPGDWNKFQIPDERQTWTKKMLAIDKGDEHDYIAEGEDRWVSGDFGRQLCLNFSGLGQFDEYLENVINSKYSTEHLGRFNLPVYYVSSIKLEPEPSHGMNGILIGDNPLNFNDWCFIEPQTDKIAKIGGGSIPKNGEVKIRNIFNFNSPLIVFEIKNGVPNVMEYDENLVLSRDEPVFVENQKPLEFSLSQNYPNPFNASTTIEYNLKEPRNVKLEIYNSQGQKLETLINDYQDAGNHLIKWNASDYSSGIYFYRLKAGNKIENKKMMLIK